MDDTEATSLEQIRAFLAGSGEIRFAGQGREEVYAWTERSLVRHHYASLGKSEKGLVRRYVSRMTGLSRAQVTRLIACYAGTGHVKAAPYQRRKCAARYNQGGRGAFGLCGQEPRQPERAGDETNTGARAQRIPSGRLVVKPTAIAVGA